MSGDTDGPLGLVPRGARWATAIGFIAALVIGLWFIFQQRFELAEHVFSSNFYDEQVRSWQKGKWAMPKEVLQVEGVASKGGLNMYFGPVPSLLRLPILLLTKSWDGDLVQPSLVLAYVVFLGSAAALWWQVRVTIRGRMAPNVRESATGAVAVFAVGAGTIYLTNLTSTAVYFEAIAWGVTLTLLSFSFLVSSIHRYRTVTAIGAVCAAGAAALTRVTVGGGALLAVWMFGIISLVAHLAHGRNGRVATTARRWATSTVPAFETRPATVGQCATWLGGAAAVSAAFMAVNFVRFGQMFSIPWGGYVYNAISTDRQTALSANDGTLVGAKFIPTTLWNYLRPDSLDFDSRIPWITFPRRAVARVGNVVLDMTAPSSSLSTTMPLFMILLVVALVAVFRPGANPASLRALRIPLVGAALCTGGMWSASFIAHRYMTDAIPLLIIGGFIGWHHLQHRIDLRGRRGTLGPRLLVATSVVLLLWGTAVNVALSVENQKLLWPNTEEIRYEFVRRQYAADTGIVASVTSVPAPGKRGEMIAVGDCEALLWSSGDWWMVLEGQVGADRWRPSPGQLFFDLDVAPTEDATIRAPDLCRRLIKP